MHAFILCSWAHIRHHESIEAVFPLTPDSLRISSHLMFQHQPSVDWSWHMKCSLFAIVELDDLYGLGFYELPGVREWQMQSWMVNSWWYDQALSM